MDKDTATLPVPVSYRDRTFRIIAALLAAHFMTVFGYEQPVAEIMLQRNYWVALIFGTLIAYCGITIVYHITVRLDRHYGWYTRTVARTGLQVLLGWMVPSVCMFLLAAGYFALFGFNILESDYMKLDFPVIVLLLLLMNAYYICYYFYLYGRQPGTVPEGAVNNGQRERFIVRTPLRSIPVRVQDICYIYILDGTVFLRTSDMADLQEAYPLPETLKEMEALLDAAMFFRINRKMIVSFDAVDAFRPGRNQTLELSLTPPLSGGQADTLPAELGRLHIVSEDRVADFRQWMER